MNEFWALRSLVSIALVAASFACKRPTVPKYQIAVQSKAPAIAKAQPSSAGQVPAAASFKALGGQKPNVRIALVGDQGIGPRANSVIDLIRSEGADFLVVLGDFDYENKPLQWSQMLDRLGHEYPWFAVVGNHDVQSWPQYEALIAAKQANISGAKCRGKPGLQASCVFRGIQLILSEIGTMGNRADDEDFIRQGLAQSQSPWKLCLWHKNQHDMQVGAKGDEVGWTAYQLCQAAGAIVVTGHEHSYARTRTLTQLGDPQVGHGAVGPFNALEIGPDRTFVVVSGLGGIQTRSFLPAHDADQWWGAYYTADRESTNGQSRTVNNNNDGTGALFLDLGVEGDPKKGRGRFVTAINKRVFDDFSIRIVP